MVRKAHVVSILALDASSSPHSLVRPRGGRAGAPGDGASRIEHPSVVALSNCSVRTGCPLTGRLLALVTAVAGALRMKLRCFDCRKCASSMANPLTDGMGIASTSSFALRYVEGFLTCTGAG